ncbi:hypothetical protein BC332_34779 [Capsicum chinense]|nr:hypothetical protein BC332_34779 [Capsicum chinense]
MSVDASKDALGAVISQIRRPISFGSTILTPSQIVWGQIEKELLAIYFGCKKFDQFCYGQRIYVESDHKPLITLFRKPYKNIPLRLQRIMLKLERYDLSVKYVPGKKLLVADTLSSAPLKENLPDSLEIEKDLEYQLAILDFSIDLAMSEEKKEVLINATEGDEVLNLLKQYYLEVKIMSDNGPPFNSKEFAHFTSEWQIHHDTSSSLYPRSNGQEYSQRGCSNPKSIAYV